MSATATKAGELAIAICPDCNWHSVCDPAWLAIEGKTLDIICDNCGDEEQKPHMVVRFVRQESVAAAAPPASLPYPLRNPDEFAECLISHNIVEEEAWYDQEGWDGGRMAERIHHALGMIREHNKRT